jgi:hypothetical protein
MGNCQREITVNKKPLANYPDLIFLSLKITFPAPPVF